MRCNHLIEIQELETTTDYDDETETWATVLLVFAEIAPLTGRELVDARQVHAEITHRIRIPWREGITADQRLKWGTRIFHLLAPPINRKERNRWLEIAAKERT